MMRLLFGLAGSSGPQEIERPALDAATALLKLYPIEDRGASISRPD